MAYEWRIMGMSEHTDSSWEDLFDCQDDSRKNYCVFNKDSLRVIEDLLTLEEAREQVEYWNMQEEYDLQE